MTGSMRGPGQAMPPEWGFVQQHSITITITITLTLTLQMKHPQAKTTTEGSVVESTLTLSLTLASSRISHRTANGTTSLGLKQHLHGIIHSFIQVLLTPTGLTSNLDNYCAKLNRQYHPTSSGCPAQATVILSLSLALTLALTLRQSQLTLTRGCTA